MAKYLTIGRGVTLVSKRVQLILLVSFFTLSQRLAFAHDLDPKFENPFQLRRDVVSSIGNCKFTEAIAIRQKYLDVGKESCRQMASYLRSAYLPKELPPPPEAEKMLQQFMASDSFKERIELATKCTQAYPEFEFAHLALASIYSLKLEDSKAEKECLKAYAIAPSNQLVLRMLGIIYIHKGDLMKARRTYEQLLKVDPKDMDADAFFCEMNRKDGKLSNLAVFSRQDVKHLLKP